MTPESDSAGEAGRVVIRSFATRDAAEMVAAQLEANGIACWIAADDCGGMLPNLAMAEGVRVLVSRSDAEEARALLDLPSPPAGFEGENEPPPENPPLTGDRPPKRFAPGQILIGVVIGFLATSFYEQAVHAPPTTYYHYTADGKAEGKWVYLHGNLVKHFEDRNLDGVWDHWAYYDKHGFVTNSLYDNNFDGKPDETWTYSNGNLLTMEKDNDFNGVPDEFCIYKYGIVQQMDMRPNGSKLSTLREIFSNGVISEIWHGEESNGHFWEIVKYDPFLNPVSTNFESYPLLPVH
jgi:hypothetical protein